MVSLTDYELLLARYYTCLLSNSIRQNVNMSTQGLSWNRSQPSAVCPLSTPRGMAWLIATRRKFEHYHPPSTEVKNELSYISSPSIRLHVMDMAAPCFPWKNSSNFTLTVIVNSDSVRLLLHCNILYIWVLYWAYMEYFPAVLTVQL